MNVKAAVIALLLAAAFACGWHTRDSAALSELAEEEGEIVALRAAAEMWGNRKELTPEERKAFEIFKKYIPLDRDDEDFSPLPARANGERKKTLNISLKITAGSAGYSQHQRF